MIEGLESNRKVQEGNEKWLIYSAVTKALKMWLLFPDLSLVCSVALNEPFHFLLSLLLLLLFGPQAYDLSRVSGLFLVLVSTALNCFGVVGTNMLVQQLMCRELGPSGAR